MFLEYLRQSERFREAAPKLRRGAAVYAPSFYAPYVLAGLIAESGAPGHAGAPGAPAGWLVVAPEAEGAARLATQLGVYLECEVAVLPARGVLYGADVAPAPHVVGERQQALAALAHGGVVVAEAVALVERFVPLELQPAPLLLAAGGELPFEAVVERLAALGYVRVEQVRERGEFAVRGGIVDVYPALGEPLRVDFWGDQVESLRTFSVFSQRTIASLEQSTVFAATEADAARREYRDAVDEALAVEQRGEREVAAEDLLRHAGLRALAALASRFVSLPELATAYGARLAVYAPDETSRALADFAAEVEMTIGGAAERGRLYVAPGEARKLLSAGIQLEVVQREQRWQFAAARPQAAARDIAGAERDLARLVRDDYRVFVVFRHAGEATRAAYRLKSLSAEVLTSPAAPAARELAAPGLYFVAAPLREGFVSSELKLAVIGERALLRAAPRERRFVGGARLGSFFDLRVGDYVVHEDQGIGTFAGIETRTVGGITRDYLLLHYKGDDKLFVPHDQIGKVSRYVGAGAGAPPLNRLGGSAWQAVKTRARKAVMEMAGELLNLYAARQAVPGFAFPADGELMLRLEGDFPYEETEDQAEAIDDVKNDMEAAHPMDRLVCGDVGYGKTEVALRAAFKAAEAGKQALVLVPTTILAQQHFATFGERFAELPGARRDGQPVPHRGGGEARAGRLRRRQGGRAHRHASSALQRRDPQGPRPGGGGRGAALRRAPEGAAPQPEDAGGRGEPVGDADPAHPADVAHRGARHLRHRDAAARPPRDPYLHRRVPRRPGEGRHREGGRPRRPGLLPAQPRRDHRAGGRAGGRAGAPGAPAGGPRADARARPGAGDAALPVRRRRRAGDHVDHRERPRHPHRQHARRRARRHARSGAALPDPRPHRPQRCPCLRLPLLPERGDAHQRRRRRD